MTGINEQAIGACEVAVIGDIMFDEYISGTVSRVSPEAPVPVVRVNERKYGLGGAANVAKNIRALGAGVTLIGRLGDDSTAGAVKSLLADSGINYDTVVSDSEPTTCKTRVVGNAYQIVRYDVESVCEPTPETEAEIIQKCRRAIGNADIVVISDYLKGLCSHNICANVIGYANSLGKRVLVDPKHNDWMRYQGAYLIKPNLPEFKSAVGKDMCDLIADAKRMSERHSIDNVLITRSREGMTLVNELGDTHFPANAREVFDVSGAGDTVIAAIAVFMAVNQELNAAITLANAAAGIAVSKKGTYAVSYADLISAVCGNNKGKLFSRSEIVLCAAEWKALNKRTVFTNGCFDILHTGHIALLQKAKEYGDVLIVGLNSDDSVRRLKGETRPLNSGTDRAAVLAALECVDAVVEFEEDTPFELIKSILPDVLVKGADYSPENAVGADIVRQNGGTVELVLLVDGKSTSNIVAALGSVKQ
jgi:D-beta-D-heptose 7-phosphate kinase/D-beta-D-heptose 1-phosphate adenosyltransferase